MSTKHKEWPNVYRRQYKSGRVVWVVDCGLINGKRDRHAFDTREQAEAYAAERRQRREVEGKRGLELDLPLEVRVEAIRSLEKLAPYKGATLTVAVDHYVECKLKRRETPVISKLVDGLLVEKKQANLRPRALRSLESLLCRFADQFDNRRLDQLSLTEVKAFCLAPGLKPRTHWNRIRYVKQLYRHALAAEWEIENVAAKIAKPRWDKKEPGILSVDQAAALLASAAEFGLLAYVAVALFAGVRRAELLRLDWRHIHRRDREIVITSEVAKARSRRVIAYGDALAAWLELCAKEEGPLVDVAAFDANFQKLRKAAGIVQNWPHNALRHSFASYHLACYKDEVRTAYLMGHRGTTETLHSQYKGLVSGADAERYWRLLPPVSGGLAVAD